jgi:hypothetical protein
MRLADVHAVDPSHARSVPKIRVDCAAAPKVLECLHVRERARAMPHHCGYPHRTFCMAFARADLGCIFDPGDDLECFGHV